MIKFSLKMAFSLSLLRLFSFSNYATEQDVLNNINPHKFTKTDSLPQETENISNFLSKQHTANYLSLPTRSLGNKTLKRLVEFPNIQYLFLKENCLTDKGAKYLRDLVNIREIDLSRNYITAEGLANLCLDNIEILRINFLTLNNDNGIFLEKLATANNLRELYMAGGEIDGKFLNNLDKLSNLRVMDISYNDFTNEEVQKLQQHLPSVRIIYCNSTTTS